MSEVKLIICVVDDMDIHALLDVLAEAGYQATKLSSSGGFLKRPAQKKGGKPLRSQDG